MWQGGELAGLSARQSHWADACAAVVDPAERPSLGQRLADRRDHLASLERRSVWGRRRRTHSM